LNLAEVNLTLADHLFLKRFGLLSCLALPVGDAAFLQTEGKHNLRNWVAACQGRDFTWATQQAIEWLDEQAGLPINRAVRGSDIAFADPRRPTLIKLYGDLQQRDSLVVTEDDHYGP
jgi:hypothetical protein